MLGKTVSHFRILEKIDAGGMGEVYKAQDTRLDRVVAIKTLPPDKTDDLDRRQRFFREAKAASALNHPNIVTVYDMDHSDGTEFIVMEYVQGKTLHELIPRKGMKLEDILDYSVQLADALATAHGAGIVHRDLKPGNVMVTETGLVKVLDFGLAKLTAPSVSNDGDLTQTVDHTDLGMHTVEGAIMGTVAYMSPEQAEGGHVDARSDIFSFGLLLYEMVTGQRAFHGSSPMSTVAAVITQEPRPLQESSRGVSPELERIITRCLKKDQKLRWQSIADVKVLLEDLNREPASSNVAPAEPGIRGRWSLPVWVWAVVLTAAIALALTPWLSKRGSGKPGTAYRLTRLTADPGLTFQPSISPDGNLLAYSSDRAGHGDLDIWVQQISGGQPIQLTTDEMDDYEPAFSPDGSQVAFRSDRDGGGIFIKPALGGPTQVVAKSGHRPRFSPDGRRLLLRNGDRLVGTAFITVDLQSRETTPVPMDFGDGSPRFCRDPIWSPTGQHLLFATGTATSVDHWWVVPVEGGAVRDIDAVSMLAEYGLSEALPEAWSKDGVITFSAVAAGSVRENLWQLELSPDQFEIQGAPVRLTFGTGSEVQASVAESGRIVFSNRVQTTDLWRLPFHPNRAETAGELARITQGPAAEAWASVSRDGNKVAYILNRSGRNEFESSENAIWLMDLQSNSSAPLVQQGLGQPPPVISPDGSRVFYRTGGEAEGAIYQVPTAGGLPQKVCDQCGFPAALSSDGTTLLTYDFVSPVGINAYDLGSGNSLGSLQVEDADLYMPQFSGDDRWIAFHARTRDDHQRRIYVVPNRAGPFNIPRREWIPITDGSSNDAAPHWSPAGNYLYYLSNRDGFQCLWAQQVNPATKRPVSGATPVLHLHSAGLSATNIRNLGIVGGEVTQDCIVLALADTIGNIWMMEPRSVVAGSPGPSPAWTNN